MSQQIISGILTLEFALPFILLSIVLSIVLINGKRKNKNAIRELILRIKNNEGAQRESLENFLNTKLKFEAEASKKQVKKIINERKFLFRNMISALLDKNDKALIELENDLSRITQHYHDLDIKLEVNEVVADEEVEQVDVEPYEETIKEQKQEIKTLKHEVHITLTTLNNIFGEFSSMFGEEVPDTEMSVEQIISAMESFSNGASGTPVDNNEEDTSEDLADEPDAFSESTETLEDTGASVDTKIGSESDNGEMELDLDEPDKPEPKAQEDNSPGANTIMQSDLVEEPDTNAQAEEPLDFSIDDELDEIDNALDGLELGANEDAEPSWDDAFAESGDKKEDEN